ncbi:MAG: Nif3-like dinuclear metal center hexameric protein [Bacteroidetes bacterium]|nr:Nif3-like dinuclear metal center hexameric protein [Bacteroidota bacterium]MBL6944269.1 Nif3-like dinuclear metal center hexameric protein [Bacteroidales bacterium]
MLLQEIINYLEKLAPISLQESYDNSGLLIGLPNRNIDKALITLDVTEQVIQEAIVENCELIIAHHPVIFKGLKKLTGSNLTERLVLKAVKSDIAIYAIHTNFDNIIEGVNAILAEKLGIKNIKILSPKNNGLLKVVTFCPHEQREKVQQAMFDAGSGNIGNYDSCSFFSSGTGTFRALEGSNPFVGKHNTLHKEEEYRIESIVPKYRINNVITAMLQAHPYEEPAYDIYPLINSNNSTGSGVIGELELATPIVEYLQFVKQTLLTKYIKHNRLIERKVKKVAICGGSGSFLINAAAQNNADLFITADIKYHDFFEHTENMTIADAGHFETEHPVKELLYSILKKKFPNFALQISEKDANPISFL